jgi:cytosine permease
MFAGGKKTEERANRQIVGRRYEVLADDFALERVPLGDRKSMRQILWVELGVVTAMSEFVLASALGYGMPFWNAFAAILIGSALLTTVGAMIGVAGAWEGLPTGLLARWSGFGNYGSTLISLVVVIGCIAWFGVQNSICAEAIHRATNGHISLSLASIMTGLVLVAIASFGFQWLSRTASLVVPVFLVVVGYGTYQVLSKGALGPIFWEPAPGTELSLATGASMVAGSFMLGAILAPDLTRFCRTGRDVLWVWLIAIFVGQFGLGLAGVVLAHVARSRDVISIIFGVAGWIGVTVVGLATLKLNDVNLYSSSLHLANFIEVIFRRRINRGILTVGLGLVGVLFSVLGILDHIVGFLLILGVTIPPLGGILIVDYFVLRRYRGELERARATDSLPTACEVLNPVALLAWLAGAAVGQFIPAGVASLNAALTSGVVYFAFMQLLAFWENKPIKYFPAVTVSTADWDDGSVAGPSSE